MFCLVDTFEFYVVVVLSRIYWVGWLFFVWLLLRIVTMVLFFLFESCDDSFLLFENFDESSFCLRILRIVSFI